MEKRRPFKADPAYMEMIRHFGRIDAVYALILYSIVMLSYALLGVIHARYNVYWGNWLNLILIVVCIAAVIYRRQKLETVGLTLKKLGQSALWGLVLGAVVFAANMYMMRGGSRIFVGMKTLMYNIYYYFIVIALCEEIIFRGFIQTRLYGLIRSEVAAVLLGSVLFAAMHLPYHIFSQGIGVAEYLSENYLSLIFTVVWHVVFNMLYRKFNNLAGPVIMHGLINLSNFLFL